MTTQSLIELIDINYAYDETGRPALSNITLTVQRGEWVHIVGTQGAGKTTLSRLLCGLLHRGLDGEGGAISGLYRWEDRLITAESSHQLIGEVGAVFRDPESALTQEIVEDELAFGPENMQVSPDDIERRILQALEDVDMARLRYSPTCDLSGGQQQRIAIASMLTMKPKLLILDDAVSYLDAPARRRLEAVLQSLHRSGHTLITTSSRIELDEWENQLPSCSRIIGMEQGRIQMNVHVAEAGLSQADWDWFERNGCAAPIFSKPEMPFVSRQAVNKLGNPIGSGVSVESKPLLTINGLDFSYLQHKSIHQPEHNVLTDVNLEVRYGECVAILGPNGSGKSTLGKLIAGLLPAPMMSIAIEGRDITTMPMKELSAKVGYVFQYPNHQFLASTVYDECSFGLLQHGKNLTDHHHESIEAMLKKFSLYDIRDRNPHECTEAEKRLINLASVLLLDPQLIILDEPTAGMDVPSTDQFMSYCTEVTQQGKSILMITHDTYAVRRWTDRSITLNIPIA